MSPTRPTLRLAVALLALVQAVVPGVASILDARPAAVAYTTRPTPHVEEPGTEHPIPHQEQTCALCSAATHETGDAPAASFLPASAGPEWPPRESWFAHNGRTAGAATRSRAPPA